ncbi:MAG: Ppx/GppA family phosphatase [Chthonomonadales bacterium]|nr:Ppx/GppA family phosphatase [Chthonomonadales bacterium]
MPRPGLRVTPRPGATCAAIDIGSNTVKLLIAERRPEGWLALVERSWRTRLGERIGGGRLSRRSVRRTLAVLEEAAALCRAAGALGPAAVATSAVRDAANADALIAPARRLGVEIQPIAGEEEARLSFEAVRRDALWRDELGLLVVDIGGGSTEVIWAMPANDEPHRVSLALGAVRLTEAALHSDPPAAQEVARAEAMVADTTRTLAGAPGLAAVGVGGTFVNMAGMAAEVPREEHATLHGAELAPGQVDQQVRDLAAKTVAERERIVGLDPSRADIILGGALIVRGLMRRLDLPRLAVSCRGLRWGVLYDRWGA